MKQKINNLCKNCHTFKKFGTNCYYYWNDKKVCTMFRKNENDTEHYKEGEKE